jgi:TPR repeat protein
MSKKTIKLSKASNDEVFKKLTQYVKNTKKINSEKYYQSHKMIDTILERHKLTDIIFKWLNKFKSNPEVKTVMAKIYYFGSGVERDYSKSVEYLQKSDTCMSKYLLGNMYSSGSGIKCNEIKALELFRESAKSNMYAQYTLWTYRKDQVKFLKLSADQGYLLALYALAQIYDKNRDNKNAILYYRKCIAKGHPIAKEKIEIIIDKMDYNKQIVYYERRIKDSLDKKTYKKLIHLYRTRMNTFTHWHNSFIIMRKKIYDIYNILGDKMDADDLYWHGMMMINSYISKKQEGISLLRKSAKLGNSYALFKLGEYGDRDGIKAIEYIQMAAEKDNPLALYYLAVNTGNMILHPDKALDLLQRCVKQTYLRFQKIDNYDNPIKLAHIALAQIYSKGKVLDVHRSLYNYAMANEDSYVNEILTKHNLTKEVFKIVYHGKKLDIVESWILSPECKIIKYYIEEGVLGDITYISKVVRSYFKIIEQSTYEMRRVLNITPLYIKVLHDMIEKYLYTPVKL